MYLTGASLLRKVLRRGAAVRYIPEKRTSMSIFFDYRLVTANDKYYQLIAEMVTNLIIR